MKPETYKLVESALSAFLAKEVGKAGFTKISPLRFGRNNEGAEHFLSFPLRVDRQGRAYFQCIVGARFEELSNILKDNVHADQPMIFAPLHLLRRSPVFCEWAFSSTVELESLVDTVSSSIKFAQSHFYSRLANIDALVIWLKDPESAALDALTSEQRVCLLAAAICIQGHPQIAARLLNESIANSKGQPLKRTALLRTLLPRIEANG